MNGKSVLPPPPQQTLQLPPDAMLVFLEADLAVHILNGIQAQMRTVGRALEANFISVKAQEIAAWRDDFRRRTESPILLAGAA